MATTNNITGDKLISKTSNENFRNNFDDIDWSIKSETDAGDCCGKCKKPDVPAVGESENRWGEGIDC